MSTSSEGETLGPRRLSSELFEELVLGDGESSLTFLSKMKLDPDLVRTARSVFKSWEQIQNKKLPEIPDDRLAVFFAVVLERFVAKKNRIADYPEATGLLYALRDFLDQASIASPTEELGQL